MKRKRPERVAFFHSETPPASLLLQAGHQIGQPHLHRCGNPHQSIDRDIFLSALDVPDVVVVKLRLLRQLLLAPFQLPAMKANIFAQNLPVL